MTSRNGNQLRRPYDREVAVATNARPRRGGLATTELAVTLPLLLLLVFGSIETANRIFLNQTLALAAYEGAREASRPEGTRQRAESRAAEVLNNRGITGYTITVAPPDVVQTERGVPITVTVRAPADSFATLQIVSLGTGPASQSATMVKQ